MCVALCCLGLCGCLPDADQDGVVRVVCVGDSNSLPQGPPDPSLAQPGWCQLTADLLPTAVVVGPDGALVDRPTTFYSTAMGTGGAIGQDNPVNGFAQVQLALESLAPDVLILALGSADLLRGTLPAEIRDALLALRDLAAGTRVYVALVPPFYEPRCPELVCVGCPADVEQYCEDWAPSYFNERIGELNDLIRASVPPGRIIDFHSIVTSQPLGTEGDFADAVHLTPSAQVKRAAQTREVLAVGH